MLYGPFPPRALIRGISDGAELRSRSAAERSIALTRVLATSARVVRIPVPWNYVAVRPPGPGFDAADPASPMYHFGFIDAAVRDASARGLQPLLVVSHAPRWAEAQPVWDYAYAGAWAPDPNALEAFAVALARRYGGAFPDPAAPGVSLPRVTLYQAWNEPNVPRFLAPQWIAVNGRWTAFSPGLYRAMLNAFYEGVKSVSDADVVIAAGLAPTGDPRDGAGRMTPVRFLRSLFCLADLAAPCPSPAHADVIDFHPLSVVSPDLAAPGASDVAIADLSKLTTLVGLAVRRGGLLPPVPKRLFITELNWPSEPALGTGVPLARQTQFISRALHRLWVAGASLVAWQFLVDPQLSLKNQLGVPLDELRPDGLYTRGLAGPASDRPKPFLLGFSFPFDPLRMNRKKVRLWALLPAGTAAARLQRRTRRGWVTIGVLKPTAPGLLNRRYALRGRPLLRLVAGGLTSPAASITTVRH